MNLLISAVTSIFLLSVLYYYTLLFLKAKKSKPIKKFSSITIIIPAHNEALHIRDSINSVKQARFNGRKQIIVVDDGSTDRTAEVVAAIKGVKLVKIMHAGKSAAINKALTISKGELIAIVDADSQISSNSLQELAIEVSRQGVVAATGIVKIKNRKKLLCMWPHIEQLYNSLIRSICSKINTNIVTPGPLSVYRAKELKELGGFGTKGYAEDIDVAIRLIRQGHKIGFSEKAISETTNPTTLKEFLRQRMRWSKGMIHTLKRHLQIKITVIDLITLPLVLFAFVQAIVMGLFTFYQIYAGYTTYFLSKGIIFNLQTAIFFFNWISITGFVRWVASVLLGLEPLTFITVGGIFSTMLSYPLYLIAIIKYDKKFDVWHLIPLFFMAPFWWFVMFTYVLSIPEWFNRNMKNIWQKNE